MVMRSVICRIELTSYPTDDETDMKELEDTLRSIEMDGLVWGASKLVTIAFGVKKLQINLVVEDEKVSLDDLQGKIEEDEDHVQSTDVVSSPPANLHGMKLYLHDISVGCDAKAVGLDRGFMVYIHGAQSINRGL